jgi:hypothetical protein
MSSPKKPTAEEKFARLNLLRMFLSLQIDGFSGKNRMQISFRHR